MAYEEIRKALETDIFSNKKALYPSHPSNTLINRKKEAKALISSLKPTIENTKSQIILVSGPEGTGKTMTTTTILTRLKGVQILNIPCQIANTIRRALVAMLHSLNESIIPYETEEMKKRVLRKIEASKRPLIIYLQDFEWTTKRDRANMLSMLLLLPRPKTIIIETRHPGIIDRKALECQEIRFLPYTDQEIEQILKERSFEAFSPGALQKNVISTCAKLSRGNAKKAIKLLKTAGEVAEAQNLRRVTPNHVQLAAEQLQKSEILETLDKLPPQSKLVLHAILTLKRSGRNRLVTNNIYESYQKLCEEKGFRILTRRGFNNHLANLLQFGLITLKPRPKGSPSRTRTIGIDLDPKLEELVYQRTQQA